MAQHCITHCITGQPRTSITGLNVLWWGHHLIAHMGFPAELASLLTNGIPSSLLPNPSVDVSLQPLQGAAPAWCAQLHCLLRGSPYARLGGITSPCLYFMPPEAPPEQQQVLCHLE